jgi:hypothetical protein
MAAQESWQEREARLRRQAEQELGVVCEVLRRLGVEKIEARYDGAGDEGWVKEIRYSPEPPAGLPEGLPQRVENFVYTRLPSGWEINEGSFGTMTIDVQTARAALDHHWKEEDGVGDEDAYDEEWE